MEIRIVGEKAGGHLDRWVVINKSEAVERSKIYLGDYMRSFD